MTPPSTALPTERELTDYPGALKIDEQQHTPRRPSVRGGTQLDPMIEDEYRFGWFGQADYDGHLGGGA
ncbi:hypothetical protein ACBJ59_57215 [Nonomuraea sp. MTCD27]|uniref:hypothetical protein n=1 Tax=Nonomuraea sp. MTCD27 TaxID=1676747 RepID=UPI0035BF41E5